VQAGPRGWTGARNRDRVASSATTGGERDVAEGSGQVAGGHAVTVGSATVDIITIIASRDIERVTMANATASFLLLEEGRKIEAEGITIHPGGGAANTAVCFARLGIPAAPLVKIGRDLNGAKVLESFAREGLSDRLVRYTDELGTGITVMIASHDRNAAVFTFRGANTLIRAGDIPADAFAGASIVHVAGLSNESADQHPDIVRRARKAGAFVSNNPGIRQLTARGEAFFAALSDIDMLSINRIEAEAMLPGLMRHGGPGPCRDHLPDNPPQLMRRGLVGSGFDMPLEAFCRAVHRLGPRYVTVTDGTDGAYLSDAGELWHCPPLKVKVAGTVGAGDAFSATLGAWLMEGRGAESALRAAAANAAAVVAAIDAQSGLLRRTELTRWIEAAPPDFVARRLV
jgi:ribokinase